MKLYNTMARKVETFQPQKDNKVSFYSCGPTVYDYPHIGNWYTFIRYDLLARALRTQGFDVNWVMNITDVGHLVSDEDEGEDKLEKGAKREGTTAWDIAKKYTQYFEQGLDRLNIIQPNKLPKATEHITEQIELIQKLEKNGHTYTIDDGVYFDTSTFPGYGKLAKLDLSGQKEGARIATNEQKRNSSDFALWKFSPELGKRDMEWESPWGVGFPGWHIECSAMSMKYLGETLDIHGGGIDHIPVHHTNEIAQSEGATSKPFSRFWFHSYFNLVDGKKMSKSAGSFITLEDIEAKGFDLMAFRILVLQSHYRTEAHFSWENLKAAQNRLKNFNAMADLYWNVNFSTNNDEGDNLLETTRASIEQAIKDDLNTPQALAVLSTLASNFNLGSVRIRDREQLKNLLIWVDSVLGTKLSTRVDISKEQKNILKKRQAAKTAKDFILSDQLRDELLEKGLEIRDTDYGQIWSRI